MKPTGVMLRGGGRIDVPTWKKVVEVILQECDMDTVYHNRLMELRGKVSGRNRVLLADKPDEMRSPVKMIAVRNAER